MAVISGPTRQPADPAIIESFKRHRRNGEYLAQHHAEFMDQHLGEWVLVYDGDQSFFIREIHEIPEALGRLSREQRASAVLAHLHERPLHMIL